MLVGACSSVAGASSAIAQTGRFAAPAIADADPSTTVGGGAVQVVLSLALVIGAIVVLGWLARRLRVMPRGRSGALRVVDEIALGAKERAVILEVDGARLVLGVGEGRVALLHRGEASSSSALPSASTEDVVPTGAPAAQPSFGALLQKALGR